MMRSADRSPIMIDAALALPAGTSRMIEASATRSPSRHELEDQLPLRHRIIGGAHLARADLMVIGTDAAPQELSQLRARRGFATRGHFGGPPRGEGPRGTDIAAEFDGFDQRLQVCGVGQDVRVCQRLRAGSVDARRSVPRDFGATSPAAIVYPCSGTGYPSAG
jgi:hypothetical protein